jgi:hypothetical protein
MLKRQVCILIAVLLIFLIVFPAFSCGTDSSEAKDVHKEPGFTSILKGFDSSLTTKEQYVIKNEEGFKKLWQDINAVIELPEVDFSKEMVIAVFMGEKPTGGYGIEVTSVYEYRDKITVNVKEKEPGPDEIVTQALTYPYHIVTTKSIDKEVVFDFSN